MAILWKFAIFAAWRNWRKGGDSALRRAAGARAVLPLCYPAHPAPTRSMSRPPSQGPPGAVPRARARPPPRSARPAPPLPRPPAIPPPCALPRRRPDCARPAHNAARSDGPAAGRPTLDQGAPAPDAAGRLLQLRPRPAAAAVRCQHVVAGAAALGAGVRDRSERLDVRGVAGCHVVLSLVEQRVTALSHA